MGFEIWDLEFINFGNFAKVEELSNIRQNSHLPCFFDGSLYPTLVERACAGFFSWFDLCRGGNIAKENFLVFPVNFSDVMLAEIAHSILTLQLTTNN